jgi:hypothetical protein
MAILNKFRRKRFNDYLISVLHKYNYLSVRSLSRAVDFKKRLNHKDQRGFPIPCKERHWLIDGSKNEKADIEFPLEHGEVINYTQSPQRYRQPSKLLPKLPERKETAGGFHHEANGCDRRN